MFCNKSRLNMVQMCQNCCLANVCHNYLLVRYVIPLFSSCSRNLLIMNYPCVPKLFTVFSSLSRCLPASLEWWWVGLGSYPFVAYPSCGGWMASHMSHLERLEKTVQRPNQYYEQRQAAAQVNETIGGTLPLQRVTKWKNNGQQIASLTPCA